MDKCFLSYNAADKKAVDDFCETFSGSFIRRGLKMEDYIIDSTNTDYVMKRIRELYLKPDCQSSGSFFQQ